MNTNDQQKIMHFCDAMEQSFPSIREAHTPSNQVNFGIVEVTPEMKQQLGLFHSEAPSQPHFQRFDR